MRLATDRDIIKLTELYNSATAYANTVGHIDWAMPFPLKTIAKLIDQRELYCIDDSDHDTLVASFQLKNVADPQKWPVPNNENYAYIGKLAIASSMHGTDFGRRVVFAQIENYARQNSLTGLRLECLADNPGLKRYYLGSGFVPKGEITIQRNSNSITLARFQKLLQ